MKIDSSYIIEKLNNDNKGMTSSVSSEEDYFELVKNREISEEALIADFKEIRLRIGEHMKLDNVMFLFGNGASIYAGSRDTKEFTLQNFSEMEEFCEIKDVLQNINGLGIEEQLNALITIRAYYEIVKDRREVAISTLINMIKKDLINSFVNSIDYRKLIWHEVLLRKLRSFGCLNKTQIYTPNYDLAFEYSLDALGIEYNDGFSGFVNRLFDPRTLVENNKTSLVKVHGSVNWIYEDGHIKEMQPKFENGKVVVNDTQPVLIYPTSNKLYQTYSTPYSELMRHMLNELESGKNTLIVLGYKYGDDHINEILYKALKNPNNIFYFFIYGNPENCEFIHDVSSLADDMPNINIISGKILASFDTFVKYLMPATPEKTDEERALELLQKVLER
ncbi:SIR2 family protein [Galactobacillus timonensis]|uniref:SIR2 family protein n=1 Tax=Galactobacillus timonensis TaxID=2041840 RepID=UPI000C82763D|nr:SIR2 family protein [Galactobacillus timonensis]